MVEDDAAHHLDVTFRGAVTHGAAAKGVNLPRALLSFEVTEEAGRGSHFDVGSHHNLRMTARAPELSPSALLFEVGSVVKDNLSLELDLAIEKPSVVASRTEAAPVLHLGEGLRAVGLRRP